MRILYAKDFDFSRAIEREYDDGGRVMGDRERAVAWKLIPQLAHRQQIPGGHCPLLIWHQKECAVRKGGDCICAVEVAIDLPGKN